MAITRKGAVTNAFFNEHLIFSCFIFNDFYNLLRMTKLETNQHTFGVCKLCDTAMCQQTQVTNTFGWAPHVF